MKTAVIASLIVLTISPALAQVAPRSSSPCDVGVARLYGFLIEEAKGTRHEAQIESSIEADGMGSAISAIAATMTDDQCAYLMVAPDSALRAMAITMLPERMGN